MEVTFYKRSTQIHTTEMNIIIIIDNNNIIIVELSFWSRYALQIHHGNWQVVNQHQIH